MSESVESDRVHCATAKVCVKSANQLLQDAEALHRAGEHGAAMALHESITSMHQSAIDHLEAVPDPEQPPDGEEPPDDPDAKEARRLRAARAQAEARRLLAGKG